MMWCLHEKYRYIGIDDVNYDVDWSKDIYSCFQADKYMDLFGIKHNMHAFRSNNYYFIVHDDIRIL